MKVQLRNKAGQFCTFGDFCKESPGVWVNEYETPSYAADNLETQERKLIEMRRLCEIANKTNAPHRLTGDSDGIWFSKDGCWNSRYTDTRDLIEHCEKIMEGNRALARIWHLTEYETDD